MMTPSPSINDSASEISLPTTKLEGGRRSLSRSSRNSRVDIEMEDVKNLKLILVKHKDQWLILT